MKSKRTLAVVAALAVVALLFAAAGYAYTASTTTTGNTIAASYYIVTPVDPETGEKTETYSGTLADAGLQLNTENTVGGIVYTISADAGSTYYKNDAVIADSGAEANKIYKIATQTVVIDKTNIETPATTMKFAVNLESPAKVADGFTVYYSVGAVSATSPVGDKFAELGTIIEGITTPAFSGNEATMIVTFYAVLSGEISDTFAEDGKIINAAGLKFTATI